MSARPGRVVAAYLVTSGAFTLATSLIWGVNTLFLLDAGLDIFWVMLVNTAFTLAQIVFEVPTGVVADTIGRRTSLMLGIVTLLGSTLGYVAGSELGLGMPAFVAASVFLGLGYTFQTGAGEAWLVDALDDAGYDGPRERVFARGQMVQGAAMLGGTLAGGILGQVDLAWPYYVRSAILVACLAATWALVHDHGFTRRALNVRTVGGEMARVLSDGVRFGWREPAVRPLLIASGLQGLFMMYAFYSSQPFFLALLGRDLVWVSAVLVAASAAAGIGGNAIASRLSAAGRLPRPPALLAWITAVQGLLALVTALIGLAAPHGGALPFAGAVVVWLAFGLSMGVAGPVRQSFLNARIASERRATVLSLDALFADVGGSAGQPALGWLAQASSIPVGWAVGSLALLAAAPLYRAADRAAARSSGIVGRSSEEGAPGDS